LDTSEKQAPHPQPATSQAVPLPPLVLKHLKQTKPWVQFIAVVGFVGTGLLFIIGLLLILGAGVLSSLSQDAFGGLPLGIVGLLYAALACLYFFPALYLKRFAAGIRKALAGDPMKGIEEAIKHQKSFWRFAGIMLLIAILMLAIAVPLAIVAFRVGH
jgi:hypothetical protein